MEGGCFYSCPYQQQIPGFNFCREQLGNPLQGSKGFFFLPGCLLLLISMAQGNRLWYVTGLQPVPKTGNHPACTGLVPKFFVWKPKNLKISWDQPTGLWDVRCKKTLLEILAETVEVSDSYDCLWELGSFGTGCLSPDGSSSR